MRRLNLQTTTYRFVYEKHCNQCQMIALEYFGTKISYGKVFDKIDLISRSFKAIGIKEDGEDKYRSRRISGVLIACLVRQEDSGVYRLDL